MHPNIYAVSCYLQKIEFAKKYFTNNSIFINTDHSPNWELLGPFDYTHTKKGFCPKCAPDNQSKQVQYRVVSENLIYFESIYNFGFYLKISYNFINS